MKKKPLALVLLTILWIFAVSGTIDLGNLFNYANQTIPDYIAKDNATLNPMDDKLATLGRVLFYDTNLSSNNTVSCASCHKQEFAFGDTATQSIGLNGELTGRHSMRLINARFSDEVKFFWDERAESLENQTTQPIQDHIEMGYSGTNGDPDINDLITHLETLPYYEDLFTFSFGDNEITEERMQLALAQFVRSIQSFDSRFDDGLVAANGNVHPNFSNYTTIENTGKQLFMDPPPLGGAGCAGCHRPPEFDIDPNTLNNGVISVAGNSNGIDLTNTRAPSLRDVFDASGNLNGPLMHDGSFTTMLQVIDHYNIIPDDPQNTNLDPRLTVPPNGNPQNLSLTEAEKDAIIAFLKTLSGDDVYKNEKWSDPFETDGSITITGGNLGVNNIDKEPKMLVYPNPAQKTVYVQLTDGNYTITVYDMLGKKVEEISSVGSKSIDISSFSHGLYFISALDINSNDIFQAKFLKK